MRKTTSGEQVWTIQHNFNRLFHGWENVMFLKPKQFRQTQEQTRFRTNLSRVSTAAMSADSPWLLTGSRVFPLPPLSATITTPLKIWGVTTKYGKVETVDPGPSSQEIPCPDNFVLHTRKCQRGHLPLELNLTNTRWPRTRRPLQMSARFLSGFPTMLAWSCYSRFRVQQQEHEEICSRECTWFAAANAFLKLCQMCPKLPKKCDWNLCSKIGFPHCTKRVPVKTDFSRPLVEKGVVWLNRKPFLQRCEHIRLVLWSRRWRKKKHNHQGSHFPAVTKFKGFSRVFQGSEPKFKGFFQRWPPLTFGSVFTIQPFMWQLHYPNVKPPLWATTNAKY